MPILLSQRLALFQFLLNEFGFSKFDDVRNRFREIELDGSAPGNSLYYQNLASSVRFAAGKFQQYDENLIAHLNAINRIRPRPIRLKYYQYFSLMFTEYYLDRYLEDRFDLLEALNRFLASSPQSGIRELPPYSEEDLNKLAYWNATGSGKTFITHINILQVRHYAKLHGASFKNLLLLTPSEDMSKQHLEELERSGIPAHYYWDDKDSSSVKVIDIHKIREFASGEGVTVPLAEFERNNAIFVDEGHKGDSKEDSQWREVRNTLSERGFAFEYSATFGQIRDEDLQNDYAKCIVFDYSYGNFYKDGYGKDYWIHNLSDDNLLEGVRERQYLLQNLLLFLQQKLYYTTHREELQPYNIEDPLLIFVGTSVEPKAKGAQADENKEVISDVKKVLDFFRDMLSQRSQYVTWIDDLRENRDTALFAKDYWPRFEYLFRQFRSSDAIYDACLKAMFHTSAPDGIELFTLRNAEGEIGVKVKNADHYFALIYIGDTSSFKTPLESAYEFKKDVTSPSLFQSLSDAQKNPVNILIGARKFIEGWNNYRVSSIGLINFGRSKGSQIIQLFGRGVRLWGKENSLKRSAGQPNTPLHLEIVETLNIFGLRADYMRRFKEDLEREGIKTIKKQFVFPIKVREDLDELKLYTLERDDSKPPFETTEVFALAVEPSIKIRLDIAPRKFLARAGEGDVVTEVETVQFKLSGDQLHLVNWQDVYLKLLSFKHDRKFTNLQIQRENLKALLEGLDYQIISDRELVIRSLSDVEKVQKLALEVLKRYTERFYRRRQQQYDGEQLKSTVLNKENPNLKEITWQVEIRTTDESGNELRDIRAVLEQIEQLTKDPQYPELFKDKRFLLNAWVDAHLYQPLLKDEEQQTSVPTLEQIKPPGLNRGEDLFVEDLKNFISGQKHRYPNYDFYLLRNMSRGVGFGFYFMSGGFYPDFMLWIKEKNSEKQYLSFIDPHGLRNERDGWNSEKITLHKRIKEIEKRLGNQNLVLNSFILQPPPGFRDAAIDRWRRDDDPLNQIDVHKYARTRNVFEIPTEGNRTGPGSYLDLIIKRILGVAETDY